MQVIRLASHQMILKIGACLSGEAAVELLAAVRKAASDHPNIKIEIDLSLVEDIDAAGIWGLVAAKTGVANVRLTGHSAAVRERLGMPHPAEPTGLPA